MPLPGLNVKYRNSTYVECLTTLSRSRENLFPIRQFFRKIFSARREALLSPTDYSATSALIVAILLACCTPLELHGPKRSRVPLFSNKIRIGWCVRIKLRRKSEALRCCTKNYGCGDATPISVASSNMLEIVSYCHTGFHLKVQWWRCMVPSILIIWSIYHRLIPRHDNILSRLTNYRLPWNHDPEAQRSPPSYDYRDKPFSFEKWTTGCHIHCRKKLREVPVKHDNAGRLH